MDAPAAVEEKVCPECAETVKAAANVCRYCGYRFDRETAALSAASAAGTSSSAGARSGILVWGLASAGLMVVGAFGPWVKGLGTSVAGTDGGNDGWVVVAVAVIGALLFYVTRSNRGAGLWALVGGVIGAFVTIHDRRHVSVATQGGGSLARALVQIGWGLNLGIAASISFAIAGLVWLSAVGSLNPASVVEEPDPATAPVAAAGGWLAGTVPKGQGMPIQRRNPETGEWVLVYVPFEEK